MKSRYGTVEVKLLAVRGFQCRPLARGFSLMRDSLISQYMPKSCLIEGEFAPGAIERLIRDADREGVTLAVEIPLDKGFRSRLEELGFCFRAQLSYEFCGIRHPRYEP